VSGYLDTLGGLPWESVHISEWGRPSGTAFRDRVWRVAPCPRIVDPLRITAGAKLPVLDFCMH